ncbi:MAG: hypothetical protein Q7T82_00690 [Armatimonadota bacterium]|nr:hypothetical protein [Armatimonadota bacterium]
MELLYKPDWEETKERYKAWWAHECLDRCAMWVCSPKAGAPREDPPAPPEKVEDRWFDFDYIEAKNDFYMRHMFYGGEALPIWNAGYPGWSFVPCYLGARIELDANTGWVYPFMDKGEITDYDYRNLKIDPENHWWKLAQEMLRVGVEQARGKALVTIGAFGGCGDTLAGIRGTEQLLTDIMDHPDYAREFDQHLMRTWIEIYETFYKIIREADEGSTCFFPVWSPGRFYSSHNDFAYMISPKAFREIFLPSIEMQTQYLDHTVHHVDGVGNFAHIDALLELPRLQAYQILPGAGQPSPLHYMDVLKKVQARGKNLQISIGPDEVETALANLSARGLHLGVYCQSEEEARALLKNCERWSKDRPEAVVFGGVGGV